MLGARHAKRDGYKGSGPGDKLERLAFFQILWYIAAMKTPDEDRIRSECKRSLAEFLKLYNENLPPQFPRATTALLTEFRKTHRSLFSGSSWSLDQHRKKVMDWLSLQSAR